MTWVYYLEILFTYLPESLLLTALILYAPALAFFPRLIKNPLLFTAIPIVSYLIVGCLSFILRFLSFFSHPIVLMISVGLALIAIIRVIYFYKKNYLTWTRPAIRILLFNMILFAPLILFAMISTFSSDDALASWNYWAKMYYFSLSVNNQNYPAFYPSFLSFAYQLLGSLEMQGIVKVLLVFFPFTLLNAIVFSTKRITDNLLGYFAVVILVLLPGNQLFSLYQFYISGYADPILASVAAVSVAAIIYYCEEGDSFVLFVAILAAIASAWTKQPGMLWAGLILPLILIVKMVQNKKIDLYSLSAVIASIAAPLFWLSTTGHHFYQDSGVLQASKSHYTNSNISFFMVFLKSILHYLIAQPALLLLYVLAFFASFKNRYLIIIMLGLVVIGTILWFTFASYEIREGFYLIAVCGVLIAQADFFSIYLERWNWTKNFNQKIVKNFRKIIYYTAVFFIFLGIITSLGEIKNAHGHVFPKNAGEAIIYRYFPIDGAWVYQQLYADKKSIIAGATNYETGLFFGQKNLIQLFATNSSELLLLLKKNKVDFVLISPRISPASFSTLMSLKQSCPLAFNKIKLGRVRAQYQIFSINQQELNRCE